jgi:hypothetical protein
LSNETGLDGVKMGCENVALFFDEPLILASAERTAQLGCPHMRTCLLWIDLTGLFHPT